MAEDKLYEESNESLSDKFLDTAEDAVAAGVAAVSFYRSGGAKFFSKQYKRYESELRTVRDSVRGLDYAHINKNSLKQLLGRDGTIRKSWRDYKPQDDYKIDLAARPGTPMDLLRSTLELALQEDHSRRDVVYYKLVTKRLTDAAEARVRAAANSTKPAIDHAVAFARSIGSHMRSEEDLKKFALREAENREKYSTVQPGIYRGIIDDALAFNKEFKDWQAKHTIGGKGPVKQAIEVAQSVETLEKMIGKLGDKRKKDTILGDRPMTFGEIIDNYKRFSSSARINYVAENGDRTSMSMIEGLKQYAERVKKSDEKLYQRLRNVYADEYLRTDGKDFYTLTGLANVKQGVVETLAGTMPGKILKLRSLEMSEKTPAFLNFKSGQINPAIAALEKQLTGHDNGNRIQNDYFYIAGDTYRYSNSKDKLELVEELRGATPISARYATENNLARDMYGLNGERYHKKGSLLDRFGLGASQESNILEDAKSLLTGQMDYEYAPTIVKQMRKGFRAGTLEDRYEAMVRVNEMIQQHVDHFTPSMLRAFTEVDKNGNRITPMSKDLDGILHMLMDSGKSTTDQLLDAVADVASMNDGSKSYRSRYLSDLLSDLFRNQGKAENSVDLLRDSTAIGEGNKSLDIREQLQKGLAQEFILRYAEENKGSRDVFTTVKDLIDNQSRMSSSDAAKAKDFAYATLIDFETNSLLRQSIRNTDLWNESDTKEIAKATKLLENIVAGHSNTEGTEDATKMVKDFAKDFGDILHIKGRDTSLDIPGQYVEGDYMLIHGATGPMDIIKGINQSIIEGSADPIKNVVSDVYHQLKAGRDDAFNVSKLTMLPYFFLRRLGDNDMPSFLRFSNDELKSTWGLTKGIAKRLLPLAVGETYLEWADDTVGAVTGTRPSAGIINSLDYMDIGVRKFMDTVGIGSVINDQMYMNPVMQYWFGKDGYYDADKQRDHYANGYEPVRRGRWWDFGSVNEFRGSQIEYYEPTLTRRLNSDYYNKALYNGYWDKWSHSLLPTPTAPFSPLVYMMDPYYLENEHSEDRPYPVSGTMFEKDTPWGAVLNPTIGQLIKPVQRLHQDRLTEDGQDAKAIIYSINKSIRDTASGQHAYAMVFDREQITAGEYTAYTNPSMGEYSIDVGMDKGQEMRQKQIEALGNGPMELERRDMLYAGVGSYSSDGGHGSGFLSSIFGSSAPSGAGAAGVVGSGSGSGTGTGILAGIFGTGGGSGGASPLDMLGQTNRQIFMAAARNSNTGGIITTDRIRHSKMDDVLMSDDMQNLIRKGTDFDVDGQLSRSFRLISGIYGYGANRMAGFGESDGREIATAGDIDSFSRSFWDESLGGIGGGAAEIGRRFIPEYRRNIRWNPLLNNQPDWMVETLRFGDPYAQIPKGEARLPGKGYEALNALHPDKYGSMYGAFDRYKILADVAPSSPEFKIWKKIAQQTVKDPQLQEQMKEIQERVNEQQKQHDFYPYQILGHGVDYKNVTIKEVNNDGTFRIDDNGPLYTIAGVDFNAKHTSPNDYEQKAANQATGKQIMAEYLRPGMSVTIATDSNPYHRENPDAVHSVNAAVYIGGESLAKTLLEEHPEAVQRKKDNLNAADTWAMSSTFHRAVGGAFEALAHLDLPYVHDKYLRVRDPLESYNAEQVYGTPYQTWSDIPGTYIMPAIERAVSDHGNVIRSTAEYFAMEALQEKQGIGKLAKVGLNYGDMLLNRGAFITGAMAKIIKPGDGELFKKAKTFGAVAMVAGDLYTSSQSSTTSAAASWATAGFMVGDLLDETKLDFIKEPSLMKKFFRTEESLKFRGKYALAGAALGVVARGTLGPSVEGDGRDNWTPERTKQKWEMEDYFDRLNYIKNMGLYHKAAKLAESKEGTNMEKIFNDYDEWSKKRQEIMKESDVNTTDWWTKLKQRMRIQAKQLQDSINPDSEQQNHRFEYANGLSINDLPGVRNGVFHSEEISEEERLYTLNTLVTMGIRYNKQGTTRTQDDRDMTQLTAFEHAYGTKIPDYYQVHHIIEFSQNGPDDPSNMIALNPDDHLYITEQQHKLAEGDFEAAQIGARTAMRLGEYGRAALLYKKAAESTMYGLRADARWNDIEMALPKYERDYFQEFMKERDPDKQEEILKTVSPFLRRALKQVWGMDYSKDKGEDNDEYFKDHNLPNFLWEGWRPDSDLNNIKAKTIKNEGMLFSDFGIYESKYRDPKVINAPNLSPKGSNNPLELQAKLQSTMNGLGLTGVEVSVEPKSTKGTQSIINLAQVVKYDFREKVNDLFSGNA